MKKSLSVCHICQMMYTYGSSQLSASTQATSPNTKQAKSMLFILKC